MEAPKKPMGRPKGKKDSKPRKSPVYSEEECRKRSERSQKIHNPDLPTGYNSEALSFLLEIAPKEPLDKHDVAEMRRRFYRYLEICIERDHKIANQQAYQAIGLTKDDVKNYIRLRSSNPERADFLMEVKQFCSSYREMLANDGKLRDAIAIFQMKNYDGLKDQQEHVVVAHDPLGDDTVSQEAIEKRYLESASIGDGVPLELPNKEPIPIPIHEKEESPHE